MINFIGLPIHFYGLLIGLGIYAGWEAALWYCGRRRISKELVNRLAWWVILSGILGARIYHVVDLWEHYSKQIIKIFYLWEGGLGIWGAIIGGISGAYLFYWQNKKGGINFLKLLDVTLFGVPLAQAVGRWGNFVNNELYGRPTMLPWGINVPGISQRVHPLFIYESLSNLLLFGILVYLVMKEKLKEGQIAGVYLLGYGLIRLFLEELRPEALIWSLLGVGVAQIWAVVAIIVGIYLNTPPFGKRVGYKD